MAVIGSIRKQSGLLIILIGLAMVLFLLGDLFSGGASMFSQQEVSIGTIAGEEIDRIDFERIVQEDIDRQFGAEGASEQAKKSVRDRVWLRMINDRILKAEYAKLGIEVSPNELLDQVKNTQPGTVLYQYFTDPQTGQIVEQFRDPQTGGLDATKMLAAIQNLLNSENAKDWLPIENAIKEDVALRKYNTLISKGLSSTSFEGKRVFQDKNQILSFSYALKEFSTVKNEDIEVSDADLKTYYEKHKKEDLYRVEEESRGINFAQFILTPSPADLESLEDEVQSIKAAFAADSNDTAFVAENSDGKVQTLIQYYTEASLPMDIKDSVLNEKVGSVYGPYKQNGAFMISKLTNISMSPDSVEARHILISINDADTNKIKAAKSRLDSLKGVAEQQNNFGDLAKEFSDDLGSGEKGGELGWFTKGRMVPPFEKASFEGEIGDMVIIESQFGVHLINITNQTSDKKSFLLASVDRRIEPSKATSDKVYKEASKFAIEHNTLEKFKTASETTQIESVEQVRLSEQMIPPMGAGAGSKEVLQWVFDNEVGTVSSPFELDDKIVVCVVTNVRMKGVLDFEQAKELMRPSLITEKKAEKIIANLGSYSTLEEAAQNMNAEISRIDEVRFNDNALPNGLGREPKVLGALFSLSADKSSKPIIGNRGVFVLRTDSPMDLPEPDMASIRQEQQIYTNNLASRGERQAQEALKQAAGVEDNRQKFY